MGFFSHGGSYGIQKVPMAWKILWIWGYHRVPPCRETSELEKPPQKRLWSTDLVGGLEHGFYDFPYIGNVIIPNWRNPSFFRGVGQPPTSNYWIIFIYQFTTYKSWIFPWHIPNQIPIIICGMCVASSFMDFILASSWTSYGWWDEEILQTGDVRWGIQAWLVTVQSMLSEA